MSLSQSEIKSRAIQFKHEHSEDKSEKSEAQTFWRDFFNIWGVSTKRVGTFDEKAKTLKGTTGFIDFFWSKTVLIEHKSRGEDLEKFLIQVLSYCQD